LKQYWSYNSMSLICCIMVCTFGTMWKIIDCRDIHVINFYFDRDRNLKKFLQPGLGAQKVVIGLAISSVNFINILRAAFAHIGPKSIKRYWGFDWILTFSGSTCVKAVHRTLMKLSPGCNKRLILLSVIANITSYT